MSRTAEGENGASDGAAACASGIMDAAETANEALSSCRRFTGGLVYFHKRNGNGFAAVVFLGRRLWRR